MAGDKQTETILKVVLGGATTVEMYLVDGKPYLEFQQYGDYVNLDQNMTNNLGTFFAVMAERLKQPDILAKFRKEDTNAGPVTEGGREADGGPGDSGRGPGG